MSSMDIVFSRYMLVSVTFPSSASNVPTTDTPTDADATGVALSLDTTALPSDATGVALSLDTTALSSLTALPLSLPLPLPLPLPL